MSAKNYRALWKNCYCHIRGIFLLQRACYWLVHGHMTSNNEPPNAMSGQHWENYDVNGKQFTVTREMLTVVARDHSVQLKVALCCRWKLSTFFKICFCFDLLYNKSLNDWPLYSRETKFTVPLGTSHSC